MLLEKGELMRLCADTLLKFYADCDQLYKDFVIIPDDYGKHNLLLVTEKNEVGECFIQLKTLEGKNHQIIIIGKLQLQRYYIFYFVLSLLCKVKSLLNK